MAQSEFNAHDRTYIAEETLAAKQFFYAAPGVGTGLTPGCLVAAAADRILGIIQNDPILNEEATVRYCHTSKVMLGGAVSRWDTLASDADGKAVQAAGTEAYTTGYALEDGVAGDIIEQLVWVQAQAPSATDLATALLDETDSSSGADQVAITPITGLGTAGTDTTQEALEQLEVDKIEGCVLSIFISDLANIGNNDFILNGYVPGFAGAIAKLSFVAGDVPASTADKDIDLTGLIGATPTTGGLLTLLTADIDAQGEVKNATAITAANVFSATDNISIKCVEATAAFAEGNGTVLVVLKRA